MYSLVIMCKYFVVQQKEVVQHKEVRDRKSRIFSLGTWTAFFSGCCRGGSPHLLVL